MIFLVRHDLDRGDILQSFEGMDEQAISDMFAKDSVSFEFLTKEDFESRKSAIPPISIPDSGVSLEDRITALESAVQIVAQAQGVMVSLPVTKG